MTHRKWNKRIIFVVVNGWLLLKYFAIFSTVILKPFSKFTIWWTLRTPCYEQPRATDVNLCYGSKSVWVVTLLCYRVADDSPACQPPQITDKCPVILPVGDILCDRTWSQGHVISWLKDTWPWIRPSSDFGIRTHFVLKDFFVSASTSGV